MNTSSFADLDAYFRLPRLSDLRLSPDGQRLAVAVETLDTENSRYTTAVWELDPHGTRPARRLTRGPDGESCAGFTPTGDLLFTSPRPVPGQVAGATGLWQLPADGGEARLLVASAGGIRRVVIADTGRIVYGSTRMPSASDEAADRELRQRRKDNRVQAILHQEIPVRYWDHDLGPDRPRLFVLDQHSEPRDLTGDVGGGLGEQCTWDITPDGRTLVTNWVVIEPGGSVRHTLVAIDTETGERRTLADTPGHDYLDPRISPDGTQVAVLIEHWMTPEQPADFRVGVIPIAGGELRELGTRWDRWPHTARWTPDGSALIVNADDHGRMPLFRVDITTDEVTPFSPQDGAYTDFWIAADGTAYALRATIDSPHVPVRIGTTSTIDYLPGPAETLGQVAEAPVRLTEVTATGEDGTPIRAWLLLPNEAHASTPVPLVVDVHGGPVMSSNTWSWRLNPCVFAAHGYAVLLPDYALSTGYGRAFVQRGWGQWGQASYTDIMRLTDAAQERRDIDNTRTAALGGSAGAIMVNWIAGHTDRFAALVSHASLWNLVGAVGTDDMPYYFAREMSPEANWENSPHRHADAISTPILITHGDRDYRCPISQALQMWWDLTSHAVTSGPSEHRSSISPTKATGSANPATSPSGSRASSASWTSICSGRTGNPRPSWADERLSVIGGSTGTDKEESLARFELPASAGGRTRGGLVPRGLPCALRPLGRRTHPGRIDPSSAFCRARLHRDDRT